MLFSFEDTKSAVAAANELRRDYPHIEFHVADHTINARACNDPLVYAQMEMLGGSYRPWRKYYAGGLVLPTREQAVEVFIALDHSYHEKLTMTRKGKIINVYSDSVIGYFELIALLAMHGAS